MKTMFNITTSSSDMERFPSSSELMAMMDGFDGVELMCFEEDTRGIVPPECVIGLHMNCLPYWMDFWNGNTAALDREFDNEATWCEYYGGNDRNALIDRFRQDLKNAHHYGAEYVVFHISDSSIEESFTAQYRHSDEEVIDAACELLNELMCEEDDSLLLLLENLWQPGLTLTKPEMTARLLNGISYPNKGIMLDTGHLLHTNTALRTQEEGLAYINAMLDAHGELCQWIKGIHLNQSLTGEYCEKTMRNLPRLGETYAERLWQMFMYVFAVDRHLPFTCCGVRELIERIAPRYLTFEFITDNNAQHIQYLQTQHTALALKKG